MKLKKILFRYWWLILSIIVGLIFFNIESFIQPFLDVIPNFSKGQWFQRYSNDNPEVIAELLSTLESYALNTFDFFKKLINGNLEPVNWAVFLANVLKRTMDLVQWLVDYGWNLFTLLWGMLVLFQTKDVPTQKTTKGAKIFLILVDYSHFIITKIVTFFYYLLSQKKKILISILVILFFRGFLFTFFFETINFILRYLYSPFDRTTLKLLLSIFKSAVIMIIIYIPVWLMVIIIIYLFFSFSKNRAIHRLTKNFDNLKAFVKFELAFATIFYGVPNVGKTRLLTNVSLAIEETFIEELEDNMHSIEMSFPEINWGLYDMTRLIDDPDVDFNVSFLKENFPMYLYYGILLYKSGSMITSAPYSINDPYSDTMSVIFDWDWVRMIAQKTNSPLEAYKIITWSELDKEYNSHDDKENVSEDGTHLFFGTGSHQMERHSKLVGDYQIVTQVPLRLRAVAEYFIHIKDSKYKFPFFLGLFRRPFDRLLNWVDKTILGYESEKLLLAKHTRRTERKFRKRFDYTAFYSFLRFLHYGLSGIMGWFDHFGYNAFSCDVTDFEMKTIYGQIVLNINTQDEIWRGKRLYHSTFLKNAFNKDTGTDRIEYFLNNTRWGSLPRYKDIIVTPDELALQHSRFIEKSFKINSSTPDSVSEHDSPVF